MSLIILKQQLTSSIKNILILALPEIKEGPHDIEVSWGGTAVFTCKVQDDATVSIHWMRDEKEVLPDEKKYKILDNGSLMVQNTVENDGGYYECMVKSSDGEVKSRPARMVVRQPEYTTQGYGMCTRLPKSQQHILKTIPLHRDWFYY